MARDRSDSNLGVWDDDDDDPDDTSAELTEFAFDAPKRKPAPAPTPEADAETVFAGQRSPSRSPSPPPSAGPRPPLTSDLEVPALGAPLPVTRPGKKTDAGSLSAGSELTGTSTSLLEGAEFSSVPKAAPKSSSTIQIDAQAAALDYMVSKSLGEKVGPPDVGAVLVGQPEPRVAPGPPPPPPRSDPLGSPTSDSEVVALAFQKDDEEPSLPEEEGPLELAFEPKDVPPASFPPPPSPAPPPKRFPVKTLILGLVVLGLIGAALIRANL